MPDSILKFGSAIVTSTLNQVQFGTGQVQQVRHGLKVRKRGTYFVGVFLGVMEPQDITQAELEKRLNAMGWYKKPLRKKAKRKAVR